ncbi:MAG: hypothetical protein O3C40_04565, partial [Planctomycetota bacterium]|nr:hypothetical protein [Planctomycetota bacterium]
MDNTLIPGFITRKQASERCKRAERTLQRYWSRAIEHSDDTVLNNLKLRTEDGEVIEGQDVTKEKIDDLKKQGKNPTWFVHATWVERKYGPRLDHKSTEQVVESSKPQEGDSATQNGDVVSLLKVQIQMLEQDKKDLRDELKIKNDQIKDANERGKETHVLMRDLHGLLHDMQQRLPAPQASSLSSPIEKSDARDAVVVTDPPEPQMQSRSSPTVGKRRSAKGKAKRLTSRQQSKHKWYETPTLNGCDLASPKKKRSFSGLSASVESR